MIRLAFYYNHFNTLGHSTRVFSLVKGLKEHFKRSIKIVIFQGGERQNILPFDKYSQVHILPFSIGKKITFTKKSIEIYNKIISSGQTGVVLKKRLSLIKKVLDEFKPNVFISEYFPFGQEFWSRELPLIFRYLKGNFNCIIIGSSGYLGWVSNVYEYIRDFYDMLLIHSPKPFSQNYRRYLHKKGTNELDKVFASFRRKIHFTGFVTERLNIAGARSIRAKYLNFQKKQLILVSRGGGVFSKKLILACLLLAQRNKDLFFIISCGPITSLKEFKKYREISKSMQNVKLVKFLSPSLFEAYLKAADLSINLAGYNTITRLLYYGKKTILVPYPIFEQRWRADVASKYLSSRVIQERELSVPLLERKLRELLKESNKPPTVGRKLLSGVSDTSKILTHFLKKKGIF